MNRAPFALRPARAAIIRSAGQPSARHLTCADPRCRQVHSEVTRVLRLGGSKEPSATARTADRGAASATTTCGTTCAGLMGVGLTDLDPSKLARLQTLWSSQMSSRRVLANSSAASLNGSPAKGRGAVGLAAAARFLRDNSAAITEVVGLTDVTAEEMEVLTEIWARAPK